MHVTRDEHGNPIKLILTREDFRLEFFRAGGKGGQKQNKTSSACRITHLATGAAGESREERSQEQNRKNAFERLVADKRVQAYLRMQWAAVLEGHVSLERKVDASMSEKNLAVAVVPDIPGLPDGIRVTG